MTLYSITLCFVGETWIIVWILRKLYYFFQNFVFWCEKACTHGAMLYCVLFVDRMLGEGDIVQSEKLHPHCILMSVIHVGIAIR